MKKVKFLDQLTVAGHGNSVLTAIPFILAIVMFVLIISISDCMKTRRQAEIGSCKAGMRGVQSGLELYYSHYKYYPENLEVIMPGGYTADNSYYDPWKNQFKYQLSGLKGSENSNYQLGSAGPDGKFNTTDDIAPPINIKKHTLKY